MTPYSRYSPELEPPMKLIEDEPVSQTWNPLAYSNAIACEPVKPSSVLRWMYISLAITATCLAAYGFFELAAWWFSLPNFGSGR